MSFIRLFGEAKSLPPATAAELFHRGVRLCGAEGCDVSRYLAAGEGKQMHGEKNSQVSEHSY